MRFSWLLALLAILFQNQANAACGASTRTWVPNAGNSNWNQNNNWGGNFPNAANENAYIVSDWYNPLWPGNNYTLGCLEIASGSMTATNNQILTISGDYFRNLNPGSLTIGGANTWEVIMAGTAAQTFENVDLIPRLQISNATTVTLTESFSVRNRFQINSGVGSVVIQQNLTTLQTGVITIPNGTTVTIDTDASWVLSGSLTVNGTLVIQPGARLILPNAGTLTIGATGVLDINGTPGNSVTIDAVDTASTFAFTVTGLLDAQYLILKHMTAAGVNLNGTVTRFDNVTIHSIPSAGYGITLGAAASLTSQFDSVGFYAGSGGGPFRNVNGTAYNLTTVNFDNWSGIGDTANETDPFSKINWGTESEPVLQIENVSGVGIPPTSIGKGVGPTQFGTYAFSMSGTASVATNVTSVTFTLAGSNVNSDVTILAVYNDTNGNCTFDGPDTLIGNYTPTGTPGTVTVPLSGQINVVDSTQDCLHAFLTTATAATTGNTIGVSIASTDDVVNDQGYDISDTAGPPVYPGVAQITGTSIYRWNGGYSNVMTNGPNWTPSGVPNSTTDCEIGSGYYVPRMAANYACLNTRFQYTGTLDWNNTANRFDVYGAFLVENGFSYTAGNNAIVNIRGAGNQSMQLDGTTFPNDITINSGGVVTFEDSGTISGDLSVNAGTFRIGSGASLRVNGNITVASGTTFDIEPGGELVLANNSTLTVNSGGTLELVGSASSAASVRANSDANRYTITIANGGTIRANYYSLRNLGTNGLTINATANIDATNHLQNGNYIYPGINGANLLRLFREVPGDALDGMSFDLDGSGRTGVISVYTSTGATSDVLSMTNYAGDITGATYTNDNNYLVSWDSETNELKISQQSTAPASVNQGDIANMGGFAFQQFNAGAFNNTDLTSIRITLIGTGSAADVDSVSIFYDSACSGAGGTLIDTKSFSGTPARAIFSGITGATVQADVASPPLRCINVRFNINSLATGGKTVGAEISSSSHVTNSEGFDFNGGFSPPVNLGTSTIIGTTTTWTGGVSTAWANAGNWSNGIPNANLNCIINDQTRDPLISAGTATCKSMSIGNGILTHTGGTLEIYGSLESTGTITSSSTVLIRDNGVTPTSQNIDITSNLSTLTFNKTAGGSVNINSTVNVTNAISIAGGQNFTLNVTNSNTLIANAGLTVSGGTFNMAGGSELKIGNGQTLLVNGGTFQTSGTNDAYPQKLSNKAHITNVSGTGTWAFSATSGTVNLTGFYIDWLNTSGLNLSGTVTLSNLNGGQLRNLPSSAGMRALQINTTGSIPSTSTNFGWNWGPSNSPPSEVTSYFLGHSTGCASQTIDFDQWFGDFWPYTTASTSDKISAASCTIIIDRAKSPVSLTRLEANPYDSKVLVEWMTGNEWNHRGFNVYRSLNPVDSFVQINSEIIRNDLFSTNIHGTYAFVDSGVTNEQTYYYMLEDVSLMGESHFHGPLAATPSTTLGDPPLIQAGTIASSTSEGDGGDVDTSGGQGQEISDKVWILAQTDNYMRIRVEVPNLVLINDPLNPSYKKVLIEGYSPFTESGRPELLSKTLLIPLPDLSNVTMNSIEEDLSNLAGVPITPAPEFLPVSDTFEAHWTLDAAFYGINQMAPQDFVVLKNVVSIEGSHYLPIVIQPLKYNPVTLDLQKADALVFDLFLTGTPPWQTVNSSQDPWQREGGVKLGLLEEGMYEVSYDQLYQAGVVAPLQNRDLSHIHLMISSSQVGIDIVSADNQFNSGDLIRFYSPRLESDEEKETFVLLYADENQSSSLANVTDVAPGAEPQSDKSGFWTKSLYEENQVAIFNEPYTDETDHFVWSLIYGISGGARAPLDLDVELPELAPSGQVTFMVKVKSRTTNNHNTQHNFEIKINGNDQLVREQNFTAQEGLWVRFDLPADWFVPGKNQIQLATTGDNLQTGEYDMLYVDRIQVYNHQNWVAHNDQALLLDLPRHFAYEMDGWSGADLLMYDVSQPQVLTVLENFTTLPSDLGFKIQWALDEQEQGKRLWVGRSNELKSPNSYRLLKGSDWSNSNHQADVVYLGPQELLKAIKPLGQYRESQGYKVEYVDLQDIYNEFGHGLHNVESVRQFVEASRNWQQKPKYFVLLGDGTYDPKGFDNPILKYRFPVKFMKGSSFDYVSDHWFVSDQNGIPQEIVARIPASSVADLQTYVAKVLAYEEGARRPANLDHLTMISDKPLYEGEDFETPMTEIQSLKNMSFLKNPIQHLKRSQKTDSEMKSKIIEAFSSSSLIHYMGHGAENLWGDLQVFDNSDVQNLQNQNLPIVVAMNCLNAQFADPSLDSFAEELLFNPNGGAVAFWGSTSFSPPSVQSIYQKSFYNHLATDENWNLGEVSKMSKVEAGLSSPFEEVLYSWVIIGDPLVKASTTYSKDGNSTHVPAPSQDGASESQGGGGGCSAIASEGRNHSSPPWALILSFFLEYCLLLMVIRMSHRISRTLRQD